MQNAPGWPGIPPRWTSSAKEGVGTALSPLSRVWFTISHGILNEVYYPRVDQACIRDMGFLVTDGERFFSEEKRDATHALRRAEDGVPSFTLVNACLDGRYVIEKQVITDPRRDVVLQRVRLTTLKGPRLRLFALLSPHLVNGGAHNTAWIGAYKGLDMLYAEGDGTALAMAASVPWAARSAGFAGTSDGWQQLSRFCRLQGVQERAADGNVALCGELAAGDGTEMTVAIAFGRYHAEAAFRAKASLEQGFDAAQKGYAAAWRDWQAGLNKLDRVTPAGHNSYRISTATLRAHDSPSFPGGIIASLSIPWGYDKGDDDLGGYHLVWPRDLVEIAGGRLACGAHADARRVLDYLRAIQEADGSWPQNTWLDGVPYWRGIQMDECAFPILLADMARRNGALPADELAAYWPMVRRAASYVVTHGPVTAQDRWEEDSGLSPFTLAVEIAALLAAADIAELHGADDDATFLRETADAWNDGIERWTYATGTELCRAAGVAGYYVRIAPAEGVHGRIAIKNRAPDASWMTAADVVSPDALALVRFGLRRPDDPRILDTVRAIDHSLRAELPAGPCWRRYNADGYGEHPDGSAFNGTGVGRLWPLMTGERAHYELAAGNVAEAARLLATMEALTSRGGLMPEQVWDADDIPERELFRGQPSGSAMPLVWAHAEHVKLCRSLADGAVFDRPPQTVARYVARPPGSPPVAAITLWRPDLPAARVLAGRTLRIDLPRAATLRLTADAWEHATDVATRDSGLGVHVIEIATGPEGAGGELLFTWRWADGGWAGEDFSVRIV